MVTNDCVLAGGLRVRRLEAVPSAASPRAARSIFWFDVECGAFYSLHGADQLFQDPLSPIVIAVVLKNARLVPPHEAPPFRIESGIWALWHKEQRDRQ